MERSLLLAAVAAVAFGLLRGLEARRLRPAAGTKTAPGAEGETAAFRAALAGASAEGLLTAGLGALGLGAACRLAPGRPEVLAVFALGISLAVLLAGLGTRWTGPPGTAAPRWSAVLAADLLGSFSAAAAAALVLAADGDREAAVAYVLGVAAAGTLASMAGVALAAKAGRTGDPRASLELGGWVSALTVAAAALPLSWLMEDGFPAFGATVCGVLAGLLTTRLAAGSRRWLWPAVVLGGTVLAAWYLLGAPGVALAALGMTAPAAGWGVAADSVGILARAGGGPEEGGSAPWVPGQLFASVAAVLSVLALMAAWSRTTGFDTAALFGPQVMTGLLFGAIAARGQTARKNAAGLAVGALVRLACAAALAAALFSGG